MFLEKKIKINHLLRNRVLINTAHKQCTYASFSLEVSSIVQTRFFQDKAVKFEQLLAEVVGPAELRKREHENKTRGNWGEKGRLSPFLFPFFSRPVKFSRAFYFRVFPTI